MLDYLNRDLLDDLDRDLLDDLDRDLSEVICRQPWLLRVAEML